MDNSEEHLASYIADMVSGEKQQLEKPLQVVARLRAQLRHQLAGLDPFIVGLLGGSSVVSQSEAAALQATASNLNSRLLADGRFGGVVIVTSMLADGGAEAAFARGCTGDRVRNLVPLAQGRAQPVASTLLHAGSDRGDLSVVLAMLADLYLLLDGSEARCSREVSLAHRRGLSALALGTPAAAVDSEIGTGQEDAAGGTLVASSSSVDDIAVTVADAVAHAVVEHRDAGPAQQVIAVRACPRSEFDGVYVKVGLESGRNRYAHVIRSNVSCEFNSSMWCLKKHGKTICISQSIATTPPSTGWELTGPLASINSTTGNGDGADDDSRRLGESGTLSCGSASCSPTVPPNVSTSCLKDVEPASPTSAVSGGSGEFFVGEGRPGADPARLASSLPWELWPTSLSLSKGGRLADLIQRGVIRVLKSAYFQDCLFSEESISMRQKIPSMMFWEPDEAVKRWQSLGKCFLCIVSYPWLSKKHPDPHRFHLRRLVRVLDEYRRLWGGDEVAVILDYCSLWQRGPAERDPRSDEQKVYFEAGLHEMTLAYGHKAITSLRLMDVPKTEPRQYTDRGWTCLESIAMDCKGGDWNAWSFQDFDYEAPVMENTYAYLSSFKRPRIEVPVSVFRFERELAQRRRRCESVKKECFQDHDDEARVKAWYRELLLLITQKSKLSFSSAKLTDERFVEFGEVLMECHDLEVLDLSHNLISVDGVVVLVRALPKLKLLKQLVLKGNPLCKSSDAKARLALAWKLQIKPQSGLLF